MVQDESLRRLTAGASVLGGPCAVAPNSPCTQSHRDLPVERDFLIRAAGVGSSGEFMNMVYKSVEDGSLEPKRGARGEYLEAVTSVLFLGIQPGILRFFGFLSFSGAKEER